MDQFFTTVERPWVFLRKESGFLCYNHMVRPTLNSIQYEQYIVIDLMWLAFKISLKLCTVCGPDHARFQLVYIIIRYIWTITDLYKSLFKSSTIPHHLLRCASDLPTTVLKNAEISIERGFDWPPGPNKYFDETARKSNDILSKGQSTDSNWPHANGM